MHVPREICFRPLNVGRWLVWSLTALLFALLPVAFDKGFALTLMSQMGIMIIFALSYNMLLGQCGMLSFGHAVYSGLGAFFAIHAMRAIADGTLVVAGLAAAADRRRRGGTVRSGAWLPDDASRRYSIRDDHARHRRDGVRRGADVSGDIRRGGRHHRGSHCRPAIGRLRVAHAWARRFRSTR